ncbi:MAG TPA: hypothetical protein VFP37_08855 [Steroidobacteraceae bacterium]|nr:hypothetical protein [Steroidobacteraceae bacterium]
MSEYYLADQKAEERARQREQDQKEKPRAPEPVQEMKFSLLGDFLFPTAEPPGCDPYNSLQGKSARDPWVNRRDRR